MQSFWVDIKGGSVLEDKPSSGFTIHVRDSASRTENTHKQKVAVLVHGFTQTGFSWDPLIEGKGGLLENGYRCVAVDLRGHGQSSWSATAD
mmetsp:Transcript_20968/g.25442  ORF Transcript_20968/g.25442 Transcript_20968/m.25442 type:complete len:91 (+) Transcript_20968:162-434(+)|eukprot:CAMPEP_0204827144 /NCGR_PEP_ID=MMETSP1346-20131115/4689_1 /ASSEMBLY_ACC=CAM_ASM_000771 /TAXON_ID=215587 /ORGANISM="Aplanochytrium stocchinoi, Strain GSBS06" /LENGTH=90 /DNA_ID=CAMNT_0051955475 /DNA_START=1175 /DNA_END=1447 /DNA_ORIENTATION=+